MTYRQANSTLAELRERIKRDRALAALADETYVAYSAALQDDARELLNQLTALRVPYELLPEWWVVNQDRTQIDGRVLLKYAGSAGSIYVQIPNSGPSFTIGMTVFLQAVERGLIGEST